MSRLENGRIYSAHLIVKKLKKLFFLEEIQVFKLFTIDSTNEQAHLFNSFNSQETFLKLFTIDSNKFIKLIYNFKKLNQYKSSKTVFD